MIGIDTNVLVRHRTISANHARTRRLSQSNVRATIQGLSIASFSMNSSGYPKATIVAVLEKLLRTSQFKFEDAQSAWTALGTYQMERRTMRIACWELPIG